MDTELSDVDASFLGGDSSGYSVTSAGDVNGDGYDDILIGAPDDDTGGADAGQTHLIFGRSGGWAMDTDLSEADASFLGEEEYYHSGWSVAGAGDVNGDGYDDILIGALESRNYGDAYLVFGKASGWAMNTSLSEADVAFYFSSWYYVDFSVAGAGDVNGDGFYDILFMGGGEVFLFFGKADGWDNDINIDSSDASFISEGGMVVTGKSLNGAGDVNGDGFDDFLIGAASNEEGGGWYRGQTYLILGKAIGWSRNISLSDVDASFLGEDDWEGSGGAVSGAGDINGDGYDDILIGASGYYPSGRVYLIFGKPSGWAMDTYLSNADIRFWGDPDDQAGISVAGAGDVDGDGYDDILIGAPGKALTYLVLGRPSGWDPDVYLNSSNASFQGKSLWRRAGESIAGAGDVNGDGNDDILIGEPKGRCTYLIFPEFNSGPGSVSSIRVYSDSGFTQQIESASVNDTIYVELTGSDTNSSRTDIAIVNVTSIVSPMGFQLRLLETGSSTGKYQGSFSIKDRTHDEYRWIKVLLGDTVTVSWTKDPTKRTMIEIPGGIFIFPFKDNGTAVEDEFYNELYVAHGDPAPSWSFETNASWLFWNPLGHTISGTPLNNDVGPWWVRVRATDGLGNHDEHFFNIQVMNTPPNILPVDVNVSTQDQEYHVDFDCDDQGNITWHLATNASWLSMDALTGNLTGTPKNDDVGIWHVNVSVHDGNGGWDWSSFTLMVEDVNDPPTIVTPDRVYAFEDDNYHNDYDSIDVETEDTATWYLDTNASWLNISKETGVLEGIPRNYDVGKHYVNVTVVDSTNHTDSHDFTLEVINKPPKILISDTPDAWEEHEYMVDLDSDDDGQGRIIWHLERGARWLGLNSSSGQLRGTPSNRDVGFIQVSVSVEDNNGGQSWYNFTLRVRDVNDLPEFSSAPINQTTVDSEYIYDVNATDVDKGEVLRYSLTRAPSGMEINSSSGMISWTPAQGQEGEHLMVVEVKDKNVTIYQNFTLTVHPHLVLTIIYPKDGKRVGGPLKLRGKFQGPEGSKVEVSLDGESWVVANGTRSWSYWMDTRELENGVYTFRVRAIWGEYRSKETSETFIVDNTQKTSKETPADSAWMMWIVILILLIMALLLLVSGFRGKNVEREIGTEKSSDKSWIRKEDSEE